MKNILLAAVLAIGVVVFLKACVKPAPIEGLSQPITKMEKAKEAAEEKAGAADLKVYQDAVKAFKAAEDRFPTSFQELKDKGYISDVPNDLDYNPETGEVSRKT